jgi:hypothetical protein
MESFESSRPDAFKLGCKFAGTSLTTSGISLGIGLYQRILVDLDQPGLSRWINRKEFAPEEKLVSARWPTFFQRPDAFKLLPNI